MGFLRISDYVRNVNSRPLLVGDERPGASVLEQVEPFSYLQTFYFSHKRNFAKCLDILKSFYSRTLHLKFCNFWIAAIMLLLSNELLVICIGKS